MAYPWQSRNLLLIGASVAPTWQVHASAMLPLSISIYVTVSKIRLTVVDYRFGSGGRPRSRICVFMFCIERWARQELAWRRSATNNCGSFLFPFLSASFISLFICFFAFLFFVFLSYFRLFSKCFSFPFLFPYFPSLRLFYLLFPSVVYSVLMLYIEEDSEQYLTTNGPVHFVLCVTHWRIQHFLVR